MEVGFIGRLKELAMLGSGYGSGYGDGSGDGSWKKAGAEVIDD